MTFKRTTYLAIAAIMLTSVFASTFVVRGVSAASTSYSFNLITPNIAKALATVQGTPVMMGDTIRTTGAGLFDTSGTVAGSGSITHFKADGTVFIRATWSATDFVSFTPYGGPSTGFQGGLLTIKVTVTAPEATLKVTMQVSCLVNAPQGAPDEGTTFPGLFTERVSGNTLFHLTQ